MERNANIIFNEETIDGTTTKTDQTEMCRDVIKEYQQEVENLKMKKEQGKEAEDRPLLTASVRTSQGKYIVVCRMLLSHERQISFRWVFSHALPKMAGREYMTRVKAVMTEGDSHEMEELDLAIDRYMPQCRRIRCGWPIVFKGFRRRVIVLFCGATSRKLSTSAWNL
eukprot:scaffold4412_cov82-Amphora_coffeaeformis.AAC.1